jgi:hypothetical protein
MVFSELPSLSEVFEFTDDGRITPPCDAVAVEYVMCLLRRNASDEVDRGLLNYVVMSCEHSIQKETLHHRS